MNKEQKNKSGKKSPGIRELAQIIYDGIKLRTKKKNTTVSWNLIYNNLKDTLRAVTWRYPLLFYVSYLIFYLFLKVFFCFNLLFSLFNRFFDCQKNKF